eukprot:scaffold421361_cov84-Attheya_sp.AAC.1
MNMNASTANVLAKSTTMMTMISSSGAPNANARILGVSKATRLPLLVALIVVLLFAVPGAHGHGHEHRLLSVKTSKRSKSSKSMTVTSTSAPTSALSSAPTSALSSTPTRGCVSPNYLNTIMGVINC